MRKAWIFMKNILQYIEKDIICFIPLFEIDSFIQQFGKL